MAAPWVYPSPDPDEDPPESRADHDRSASSDRSSETPFPCPPDPESGSGSEPKLDPEPTPEPEPGSDQETGPASEGRPGWAEPVSFQTSVGPAGSLPPVSRSLPPELAGLDLELEALLATDVQSWADATVDDAMVGLVSLGSKLDAFAAQVAGVWQTRRLWATDGSRSARARLGRDTGEDPGRVGQILSRATKLRSMPKVLAAWRSGAIGTDRVDVLCRANVARRAAAFAEGEAHLVWMATSLDDFDAFARKVRLWCDLADEHGKDPDPESRARKQKESRHLDVGSGLDGVKFLRGRMDTVDGEIFHTELQRIEQELFEADWAQARGEHGDAATTLDLRRTAGQRRVDALRIMAERSAACPDGASGERTTNSAARIEFEGGRCSQCSGAEKTRPAAVIRLVGWPASSDPSSGSGARSGAPSAAPASCATASRRWRTSPLSRNYQLGYRLGQGLSLEQALSDLGKLADEVGRPEAGEPLHPQPPCLGGAHRASGLGSCFCDFYLDADGGPGPPPRAPPARRPPTHTSWAADAVPWPPPGRSRRRC